MLEYVYYIPPLILSQFPDSRYCFPFPFFLILFLLSPCIPPPVTAPFVSYFVYPLLLWPPFPFFPDSPPPVPFALSYHDVLP